MFHFSQWLDNPPLLPVRTAPCYGIIIYGRMRATEQQSNANLAPGR